MAEADVRQNQHYVPKLLLKNFAGNLPVKRGKERIYAFDREKRCSFNPNIKNIGAEFGYYDLELPEGKVSLEDTLNKIETKAARVIEKIKQERSLARLDPDDWALFAVFCANLFSRGHAHREKIEILESALRKLTKGDESIFPPKSDTISKAFALSQTIEATKEYHIHFSNKVHVLMEAPKGEVFYIGDNPIVLNNAKDFGFHGNLGLGVTGIEIYLPITPQLTIAMFHPSILVEYCNALKKTKAISPGLKHQAIEHWEAFVAVAQTGAVLQLSAENVMFMNSLQVTFSTRFIMSNRREFSVAERMLANGASLGTASMIRF
jgi:hypothetical protein